MNTSYDSLIKFIQKYELHDDVIEEYLASFRTGLGSNVRDRKFECELFLYCVMKKKASWIKLLLGYGVDASEISIELRDGSIRTTSDIALENEDYETVSQLIMADGPFPKHFHMHNFDFDDKVVERIKIIQNLHIQIAHKNKDAVTSFLDDHPQIKCAYNVKNQCALATALKTKSFEIYFLLRSKNFSVGVFDREFIKSEVRQLYKKEKIYILDLMSKSKIYQKNDDTNLGEVRKCFDELDQIEDVSIILQLIAQVPNVSINFDFDSASIGELDPTMCCDDVKGRTYERTGLILIAAKRNTRDDLLGTLAHELTHYALFITYKNRCRPYLVSDLGRRQEFERIAAESEGLKDKCDIVANAYCYDKSSIPIELIVRVPQLKAQYRHEPKKLSELQEIFKELFNFFDSRVMPDIREETSLFEKRCKTYEMNETLGLFESLLSAKSKFCYGKFNFSEI